MHVARYDGTESKGVLMLNVKRIVHNDIEREFTDEVSRLISLHAIACYEEVYGERTDKEFAVCLETPGRDVWCFVRRLSPLDWEVYMEPEKEAQVLLRDWDCEVSYP